MTSWHNDFLQIVAVGLNGGEAVSSRSTPGSCLTCSGRSALAATASLTHVDSARPTDPLSATCADSVPFVAICFKVFVHFGFLFFTITKLLKEIEIVSIAICH